MNRRKRSIMRSRRRKGKEGAGKEEE